MTIVLDTSFLVAAVNPGDRHHADAGRLMAAILRREHGQAVSCDQVLGEGLTLLQRRRRNAQVSRAFADLLTGARPFARLVPVDEDVVRRAVALHFERYDRGLSFTDCVLATLARDLDAAIASYDDHFDGLVRRVTG